MAKTAGGKKRTKPTRRGSSWGAMLLALFVGIALVVVVAISLLRSHGPGGSSGHGSAAIGQKVPRGIVQDLASIPTTVFNRVGTPSVLSPIAVPKEPITGKVPVLYVGAEFCPYCAAGRWSMIVALSRFGSFSDLEYMLSAGSPEVYPNTPTFTFLHAHYQSPYVDFQTVEVQTRDHAPLQQMSAQQQALMQQFDAPPYAPAEAQGAIPFLLVGHRYLFLGGPYPPALLDGKSWQSIASSLTKGSGPAASAIIANANELTASICALDGGKPTNVCGTPVIRNAIKVLPVSVP